MTKVNFNTAKFLVSAPSLKQCPPEQGAEVAFAGRSNAGKSSALNSLTRNSKLARTSKSPGCTQLINFFTLQSSPDYRIVDLPGYGYAKVSQAMKERWQEHLTEYLDARQCLKGLVLVMDVRNPMQDLDKMLVKRALDSQRPLHMILTKSDKISRGAAQNTLFQLRQGLKKSGLDDLVTAQTFSSVTGDGVDELSKKLTTWLSGE
ncbi:ribosome biogenesis GTP-binding protein YihA/YsxC [Candidatus Obscuribacterales bacterium]|nr:ribosome biogenesis GTP-binding protein YihA/YsxC [Candidatus Obscuribacterales bacterium]